MTLCTIGQVAIVYLMSRAKKYCPDFLLDAFTWYFALAKLLVPFYGLDFFVFAFVFSDYVNVLYMCGVS